jgi:hypothetical protein
MQGLSEESLLQTSSLGLYGLGNCLQHKQMQSGTIILSLISVYLELLFYLHFANEDQPASILAQY